MNAVAELAPRVGISFACRGLGLPRPTYYRRSLPVRPRTPRPAPPRALTPGERAEVTAVLREPRFVDRSAAQVYAQLLDEGRYLCSGDVPWRVELRGVTAPGMGFYATFAS
jgi:putative transposase